jgi:hypothetical protein
MHLTGNITLVWLNKPIHVVSWTFSLVHIRPTSRSYVAISVDITQVIRGDNLWHGNGLLITYKLLLKVIMYSMWCMLIKFVESIFNIHFRGKTTMIFDIVITSVFCIVIYCAYIFIKLMTEELDWQVGYGGNDLNECSGWIRIYTLDRASFFIARAFSEKLMQRLHF